MVSRHDSSFQFDSLRIRAEDSSSARLAALTVKAALLKKQPELRVRISFGDKTALDVDATVFSAERVLDSLHEDVIFLPRADARDILLTKKKNWSAVCQTSSISVLGNSLAKKEALESFLAWGLPLALNTVDFRSQKKDSLDLLLSFLDCEEDSLLIPKFYVDYLFATGEVDYLEQQIKVRAILNACNFTLLPLAECPGLAGQAGTAIRVETTKTELNSLVRSLHCEETALCIKKEHEIAQRVNAASTAVNVSSYAFGQIVSLKSSSLTSEECRLIKSTEMISQESERVPKTLHSRVWPLKTDEVNWFKRQPLKNKWQPDYKNKALWISKDVALPDAWVISPEQIVWVAGISTWKKLSARGVWVHGSAESLGEHKPELDAVLGTSPDWLKLTHDRGDQNEEIESLATYRLEEISDCPDLSNKTHFFWTSGSGFLQALKTCPAVKDGYHACGPGNTYKILRENITDNSKLKVYSGHQNWLSDVLDTQE